MKVFLAGIERGCRDRPSLRIRPLHHNGRDNPVISDKPVKAILDFLKRDKIDLVVMGSQGLRGIRRLKALGSVSLRVLENAECPVLIVH
ncbi:MAG: universal stress protein [Thaumarchaeota archaeon]|nr:universal stress protein [Nitrososphaerota archaeon]